MKKILCMVLSFLLLFSCVTHASESFLYFYSGPMAVTADIDADSIEKFGDFYYANDEQGNLMLTQIFSEWLPSSTAPKGCKVLATKRPNADKLLLYADGVVYASSDGATFRPVQSFSADTVIRYNCGMYTAVNKAKDAFTLHYSFDGIDWHAFPQALTATAFSVLQVNDNQFALRGIQTAAGSQDALINKTEPEVCSFYNRLVYDIGGDNWLDYPDYAGAELIYASSPAAGKFIYIFREETPRGYTFQSIRKENGSITSWNTLSAQKDMQLYIYGELICLAQNGKSLDFINYKNSWVQVTEDLAFPLIQSAYSMTGDIFFDFGYTSKYYCRNNLPMQVDRAGVEVILKDHYLAFDSAPQIINGRTMVPVRAIAEALGCVVDYNAETKQIGIVRPDGAALYMTLGADTATFVWANGVSNAVKMDASPVIVKDRTLVPLRLVSESFNLQVDWFEDTKTVVLK